MPMHDVTIELIKASDTTLHLKVNISSNPDLDREHIVVFYYINNILSKKDATIDADSNIMITNLDPDTNYIIKCIYFIDIWPNINNYKFKTLPSTNEPTTKPDISITLIKASDTFISLKVHTNNKTINTKLMIISCGTTDIGFKEYKLDEDDNILISDLTQNTEYKIYCSYYIGLNCKISEIQTFSTQPSEEPKSSEPENMYITLITATTTSLFLKVHNLKTLTRKNLYVKFGTMFPLTRAALLNTDDTIYLTKLAPNIKYIVQSFYKTPEIIRTSGYAAFRTLKESTSSDELESDTISPTINPIIPNINCITITQINSHPTWLHLKINVNDDRIIKSEIKLDYCNSKYFRWKPVENLSYKDDSVMIMNLRESNVYTVRALYKIGSDIKCTKSFSFLTTPKKFVSKRKQSEDHEINTLHEQELHILTEKITELSKINEDSKREIKKLRTLASDQICTISNLTQKVKSTSMNYKRREHHQSEKT